MTPLGAAALSYASAGIAVFPLRPRAKIPYGRTLGLHMASADVEVTRARWAGEAKLPLQPIEVLREAARKAGRKASDAELLSPVLAGGFSNVAIATGAPAGFWVLDLDGPEARAWLAAKEAEHGPLPPTPTSLTARGEHRCFAWCATAAAEPILKNRAQMDGAPVDVRGQDGYILAPPSVHPGDEKKGVPPGHVYRWAEGLSPDDLGFAVAPEWLLKLVKPAPVAAPKPVKPRAAETGRASRFGELILDRACAAIAGARVGTRDTVLYKESCGIGALIAGGEIEAAYGRAALEAAGRAHVPDAYSEAQLVRQVERALEYGAAHPRTARDQRPVRATLAPRPGHAAQRALDAAAYWAQGTRGDCAPVRRWLEALGLDPAGVPGALARMRFHPETPDRHGECRPMLMAPLSETGCGPVDALALWDVGADSSRCAGVMGPDVARRAVMLTPLNGPGVVVVGLDFADVWTVAGTIAGREPVRAVVCPTISSFSGGVMGDRWGRVDPVTPAADPERPPWRMPGAMLNPGTTEVGLLMRRDMLSAPMRFRGAVGGTAETRLRGDEAAAYFAGLAVQAWGRIALPEGATLKVRPMTPARGASFHELLRGVS